MILNVVYSSWKKNKWIQSSNFFHNKNWLFNNKDKGYTSSQINQKDVPYVSQISSNSNMGGYSSQMAKNLGDSTNEGYSSQMAKTTDKYIQRNANKKQKGSRAFNINQINYNKMKGSIAPNANKKINDIEANIGYSSYK